MIVGDGDVVLQLKERVKELNLQEKVIFYVKDPYAVMMNYTHHADIGLTLDKPSNLNYKLSLPIRCLIICTLLQLLLQLK